MIINANVLKYFLLGILFATCFIFLPLTIYQWYKDLPSLDNLEHNQIPKPTRIVDRNGILLYELYIDKEADPVKLDNIPKTMIDATLASEDKDFYNHPGFDLYSMIRAIKTTLTTDQTQGGSTLTQQLVKNLLLSSERTVHRKLKEIVLAILVETKYSKDQILEMYLNNTPYGGNVWGIQTAAKHYFDKDVSQLSLAESAFLAGLTSAPSLYSPALTGDLKASKERQKYVLNRMLALEMISKEQAQNAAKDDLLLKPQSEYIKAPHFVLYVKKQLEEMYGQKFINYGGLTITTTLDTNIQTQVEDILLQEVEKDKKYLITNAAALVISPKNSEVLAYAGSVNYFEDTWGAYDVIQGYRQPGSSIKPLIYALALEKGYTAATILSDTPTSFSVSGQKPYTPKNYDGKYRGNVSMRTALANSLNLPAVKMAQALGIEDVLKFGIKMGLSNWKLDNNYGLSIALGGREVKLYDLTNMYATFAREGEYQKQKTILSIKGTDGKELYQHDSKRTKLISSETAYIIWHILSDNEARKAAFGNRNALEISGKKVAVKTGTTDQIKDNYTLGFTPSYVVGVWVGNNDNSPLNRTLASGITGAAPIWNMIMSTLLKDQQDEKLPQPEHITEKKLDCGIKEVFDTTKKIPEKCFL